MPGSPPPLAPRGGAPEPYRSRVPGTLPLFPLGTVLVPGAPLPLHVFEERYRALVRDLLEIDEAEPREFGIISIRSGRETGPGVPELYGVGTAAAVRRVTEHEDGRYDLITVGARRFRLLGVETGARPYLVGTIEWLPREDVSVTPGLVEGVAAALTAYAQTLEATGAAEVRLPALPTDPQALAWLVADAMLLPTAERQALLEVPGTAERLREERRLLRRELGLLTQVAAVPTPELARLPVSPN